MNNSGAGAELSINRRKACWSVGDSGSEASVGQRGRTAAFSLVELLTAVSIMMVIIYALYAMFNQTQKALRANITQVDVMESGRATAEMLGRDLEQLSACKLPQTVNVYAGPTPVPPAAQLDLEPSTTPLRTNMLHEVFFLTRLGSRWTGTGYRVMVNATNGVGTLYRFNISTNHRSLTFTNLMSAFNNATLAIDSRTGEPLTNMNRVADGVLHLRFTAYDTEGRRLGWETTNLPPNYRILRLNRSRARLGLYSTASSDRDAQVIVQQSAFQGMQRESQFWFLSNALPGYIEVELGVLEPATLKRYESLADSPKAAAAFLQRQAARVHLFRQRIPIRTALQ